MNDYNTPPRNDSNLPPRSDYRETRVVRTSSGGSGWLIAGIAAALLVVGALWLTASPDGETQLTTDERPAVTDQTTIPGQTDNAPTSSITEEPATPAPAPAEEATPAPQAEPAPQAPMNGTDTVAQNQQ